MIENQKNFFGFQYLLIDAANHYGLDKKPYEDRIQWAEENLNGLGALVDSADNKPLYLKAVLAIRKAQQGIATGHLVGFDSVCSGLQIMSVLTGCKTGAAATGLIDPEVRADAYTQATKIMGDLLGTTVNLNRADIKQAIMTCLYGSEAIPEDLFGDGTPELKAFYSMLTIMCPGAYELLRDLLDSWNSKAYHHSWKMPDGFDVHIPVMDESNERIEVDELGGASFTFQFKENKPKYRSKSNAANAIHSCDAFILRELVRRCSYEAKDLSRAKKALEGSIERFKVPDSKGMLTYLLKQYGVAKMPSARILQYLDSTNVNQLTEEHKKSLLTVIEMMEKHSSFEMIAVHDNFLCHPNNMNFLRAHYREILAQMNESRMLDDLLGQLFGVTGTFPKLSKDLASYIRKSNYGIC